MRPDYEQYTVRQLREMVWENKLLGKRWMLNYVRKQEAIDLLVKYSGNPPAPENYITVLKKRSSRHRKKVYRSKKIRAQKFGAELTKDERVRLAGNIADRLEFQERKEFSDGFVSYLGSTRGKFAYIFTDPTGKDYKFTKSEVQKLATYGLEVPREAFRTAAQDNHAAPKTGKRLQDLF